MQLDELLDQVLYRSTRLQESLQLTPENTCGRSSVSHTSSETLAALNALRERLTKLEVWQERLGILDTDDTIVDAVVSGDISGNACQRFPEIRETVAALLNSARSTSATRSYPDGLPPLPPAFERHIANTMYAAVQSSDVAEKACFVDLSAIVSCEIHDIANDLHEVLLPALATEMHVAVELGILSGHSPAEQFKSYCEQCIPSALWLGEFLATYPTIIRWTHNLIHGRVSAFIELLQRFARDVDLLQSKRLLSCKAQRMTRLTPALGDRHRRGRAVRVIMLENNEQLVYKPRSVKIDVAFQEILAWLNSKQFGPPMFVLPVVDRDGYGWFPFVTTTDCADAAAVGRFYHRQGAHLALVYLLGGYDLFAENVRAHGEYPILIDLECVHSPIMPAFNGRLFDSAARQYLDESVYRAGMLPSWSWSYLGGDGVNQSALTANEGQMTPQEMVEWIDIGSATLRQTRNRRPLLADHTHLPSLTGLPQAVDDYTAELCAGFHEAYDIIARDREELLSDDAGPLKTFASAECRLVLRNTMDYVTVLGEGRHPRYLADAVRYGLLLDHLWVSRCPRYVPSVIEAETAQLWRGDVPIFTTHGSSRDLYDDCGALVQRDYFEESAIAGTRRRLQRWNSDDCARQIDIMNCAFAITEAPHVAGPAVVTPRSLSADDEEALSLSPSPRALMTEAIHIGDQLLAVSVEDERTLTWIGLGMNRAGQWEQNSLDSSLYDGGPGIGLFFLYLHALGGDIKFRHAFEKIMRYAGVEAAYEALANRNRLEDWILYGPSAVTFPYSALYLCVQARRLGDVPDIEVVLDATIEWSAAGVHRKPKFDFLNGAAGVIRVLLVAFRELGDERCLRMARMYGDILLRHGIPTSGGLGWMSEPFPHPLGGFSHGASGIAWALADLATATAEERYLEAASAALRFDRTLFSAEREVWYDLRYSKTECGTSNHWCHGIAGSGLSRLLLSQHFPDANLLLDVTRAIEMTLQYQELSDCLCHGVLGNIDICMIAAKATRNEKWKSDAQIKLARAWSAAHARGFWRSGMPSRDLGIFGLFMGTAGIGYGLLRVLRPDVVPSVLYLQEPQLQPNVPHLSNDSLAVGIERAFVYHP